MKQLANKPLILSFLLTLPIWVITGNFIVALMIGLLVSFFIAMLHSLRVIKRQRLDHDKPDNSGGQDGKC